jgi:hypothetical protein
MVHPGSPYEPLGILRPSFRPSRTARMFRRSQRVATESPRLFTRWRRPVRTTNITRHEAEPAFSGSVIVATSLHAVDPLDPDHDADIRIGSEAPKQRCPFLITA